MKADWTIQRALRDREAFVRLRHLARTKYMEELVQFWESVMQYDVLPKGADKQARAEDIFRTYLVKDADLEVSLPLKEKQAVSSALEAGREVSFAKLQQEAEIMLDAVLMPDFLLKCVPLLKRNQVDTGEDAEERTEKRQQAQKLLVSLLMEPGNFEVLYKLLLVQGGVESVDGGDSLAAEIRKMKRETGKMLLKTGSYQTLTAQTPVVAEEKPNLLAKYNLKDNDDDDEFLSSVWELLIQYGSVLQFLEFVVKKDVSHCHQVTTLFRERGAFVRLYKDAMERPKCQQWLKTMVLGDVVNVAKKLDSPVPVAQHVMRQVQRALKDCPWVIRCILRLVSDTCTTSFPEMRLPVVGSFVFLRWIGPAMASPFEHGLCRKEPSQRLQTVLRTALRMLLSKSSMRQFTGEGSNDPAIAAFTDLKNNQDMEELLEAISVAPTEYSVQRSATATPETTESEFTWSSEDAMSPSGPSPMVSPMASPKKSASQISIERSKQEQWRQRQVDRVQRMHAEEQLKEHILQSLGIKRFGEEHLLVLRDVVATELLLHQKALIKHVAELGKMSSSTQFLWLEQVVRSVELNQCF